METKTKKRVQLNGVYETLKDLVGYDNVLIIYEYFKGSQVNFPTKLFSKDFVISEAAKEYDGSTESLNRIASKYSYSQRTIRKMLQENNINNDDTSNT